jgi:hypothetical protein
VIEEEDSPRRHRGHGEKQEKKIDRRDAEAQRRRGNRKKLEIRNSKLEENFKLERMKRSRARSKRFPVFQSRRVSRRGGEDDSPQRRRDAEAQRRGGGGRRSREKDEGAG